LGEDDSIGADWVRRRQAARDKGDKRMTDMEKTLQNIKRMGTAKIAGLTCNKHAEEIILRIDLQVPVAQAESALEALGLEPTKQLLDSLETALQGLKKRVGKGYSGQA
jgi:hypothetical protein